MDERDEQILDILKGDARISFQELGDRVGISRVAAQKRVKKLEEVGVIRGYNTCIYRFSDVTMFIEIVTKPGMCDEVLEYIGTRTAFIRQIFRTAKQNHIHIVAASDSIRDLKYLAKMIFKKCEPNIEKMECNTVTEVIKDVYGGIRYERRPKQDLDGNERSDAPV